MALDRKDATALLDMARKAGKTEDEIADLMLGNLAAQFLQFVDRQALARALERLAVRLMEPPTSSRRN